MDNMNNLPYDLEKEEVVKSELLELYNIIDWIDFVLVIAVIVYIGNAARGVGAGISYAIQEPGFAFYNLFDLPPSIIGLLLTAASLIVCIAAIIVARLIHKKGAHRSRVRLFVRYLAWGIWIPIDLYFLGWYAVGLIRQ